MAGAMPLSNMRYLTSILRNFTRSDYLHCNALKPWYRSASTSTDCSEDLISMCNELKAFPPGSKNLRHLDQLRQFVLKLQREPECAHWAWKNRVVPILVELEGCGQEEVEAQARMALALLGYAPPYAGKGLRILSIDGGGTRCGCSSV